MTLDVHALMEDADDLDAVGLVAPVEDHMRSDGLLAVSRADRIDAATPLTADGDVRAVE